MAKRSRMAVLKRQREIRKAEKQARKRAKRHGTQPGRFSEPQPTVRLSDLTGGGDSREGSDPAEARHGEESGRDD